MERIKAMTNHEEQAKRIVHGWRMNWPAGDEKLIQSVAEALAKAEAAPPAGAHLRCRKCGEHVEVEFIAGKPVKR